MLKKTNTTSRNVYNYFKSTFVNNNTQFSFENKEKPFLPTRNCWNESPRVCLCFKEGRDIDEPPPMNFDFPDIHDGGHQQFYSAMTKCFVACWYFHNFILLLRTFAQSYILFLWPVNIKKQNYFKTLVYFIIFIFTSMNRPKISESVTPRSLTRPKVYN